MDKIQKGVCMEKAKAFNEIVKLCKLNDNKIFKQSVESAIHNTLFAIDRMKFENKGKS